jgi:CheY-like chemotaxis protein
MNQSRIFVVEDDADDRDFLTTALGILGCTNDLVFFYSYKELLDYLDGLSIDKLPQLIILDNQIQSINATHTIQQLLSNLRLQHIKLAIYTASLPAYICAAYIKLGVDLCLEKGANMEEVNEDASKFCRLAASARAGAST